MTRSMLVLALCVLTLAVLATARVTARAQEASSALYVRTDSDETTVITPRLRASTPIEEHTRAELVYAVDVWTSASVDVRTSASLALDKPRPEIVEQRDEIDASLSYELEDTRASVSYRYSDEPDYESHGGSLSLERDFAQRSTTAGLHLSASIDEVGRVGEPDFARSVESWRAGAQLTQVITKSTLVVAIYELSRDDGYLSSPYRYVGVGSDDGSCHGDDLELCVPETSPAQRSRHALAIRGKQALGSLFSTGLGYRYYVDDWGIDAHTLDVAFSYLPAPRSLLELRYRLYTQGAADHYRASFEEQTEDGLYTRDKELSPLDSQRVMLDLEHGFELSPDATLTLALSLGPTFYRYRDFVPLDHITAWETTFALGFAR